MIDPVPPVGTAPGELDPPRGRRSAVHASDVVPIGPALIATIFGFLLLLISPWSCLHIVGSIGFRYLHDDPVTVLFVLASWEESVGIAAFGALGFLVIGVMLQVCRLRRPFRRAGRPCWPGRSPWR